MERHRNTIQLIISIGFLSSLCILLVNDHLLKEIFSNWITGKLSDFSGLFIFPIFWTAFFPNHRNRIYCLTALFFIWWKSPYSQEVINFWNSFSLFNIGRSIDYTDYIAISILPVSYLYLQKRAQGNPNKTKKGNYRIRLSTSYIIALIAFLSFTATSKIYRVSYEAEESSHIYIFESSKEELVKKIYEFEWENMKWHVEEDMLESQNSVLQIINISFPSDLCRRELEASIKVEKGEIHSIVKLLEISAHNCSIKRYGNPHLLKEFETKFIEKLGVTG